MNAPDNAEIIAHKLRQQEMKLQRAAFADLWDSELLPFFRTTANKEFAAQHIAWTAYRKAFDAQNHAN